MNQNGSNDSRQRDDMKLRLAAILAEVVEVTNHWIAVDGLVSNNIPQESIVDAASLLSRLGLPETAVRLKDAYSDAARLAGDLMISILAEDASPEERRRLEKRFGMFPDPDVDEDIKQGRVLRAVGAGGCLSDLARSILRANCQMPMPEGPRPTQADDLGGQGVVAGTTDPLDGDRPVKLLFGWADIAEAVGQKNDEAFQKRVKALHARIQSPIVFGGQGKPPTVDRAKLLSWWNTLADRLAELESRRRDSKETTRDTYKHGRDGIVVPDIGGHVKKRRTKR